MIYTLMKICYNDINFNFDWGEQSPNLKNKNKNFYGAKAHDCFFLQFPASIVAISVRCFSVNATIVDCREIGLIVPSSYLSDFFGRSGQVSSNQDVQRRYVWFSLML